MEKNNEILKKALDEAMTAKYSDELNNAPIVAEVPSPEFTSEMNNLVRKTDRPFLHYAKYTLIAACATLIVGTAIVVPALYFNGIRTENLDGADNAAAGAEKNEESPSSPIFDAALGENIGDITNVADNDSYEDGETDYRDTYPDTEIDSPSSDTSFSGTLTDAVLSQSLMDDMFSYGVMVAKGEPQDNTNHAEFELTEFRSVTKLIYTAYGAEATEGVVLVPDISNYETNAYIKLEFINGGYVTITLLYDGTVMIDDNGMYHRVSNIGEKAAKSYIELIVKENGAGTDTTTAISVDIAIEDIEIEADTLKPYLDKLQILSFTEASLSNPINPSAPLMAVRDSDRLSELYDIIYGYSEQATLTATALYEPDENIEYVRIRTNSSYATDIIATDDTLVIGRLYQFDVGTQCVKEIMSFISQYSDCYVEPNGGIYTENGGVSEETLQQYLDGKEITAFTEATNIVLAQSSWPLSLKNEKLLEKLFSIVWDYGNDATLKEILNEDNFSLPGSFIYISTDDDGGLDLIITENEIILGNYYVFEFEDDLYYKIWEIIDNNAEGFSENFQNF